MAARGKHNNHVMPDNKGRITAFHVTPLEQVVTPAGYYGLKAIAKRMGMSATRVKTLARSYHFPLVRMPGRCSRGWLYFTDENLLLAWFSGMILNTRRYLLENKPTGNQSIRETSASLASPLLVPEQVPDNPTDSSIQQVTSIQACSSPAIPLDTSASGTSTNPNEINELTSRSVEGGGV